MGRFIQSLWLETISLASISMYKILFDFLKKYLGHAFLYKFGFNISPMYRRSTGRIKYVSPDLLTVKIKIPLNYKNRNYVGTIFGGSLYSATDPIYMIQLVQILGNDYVVWDKEATIKYKRPAKKSAYADFVFTEEEIEKIKQDTQLKNEIDIVKEVQITDSKGLVYAEVSKTIYISTKAYYKEKLKAKT